MPKVSISPHRRAPGSISHSCLGRVAAELDFPESQNFQGPRVVSALWKSGGLKALFTWLTIALAASEDCPLVPFQSSCGKSCGKRQEICNKNVEAPAPSQAQHSVCAMLRLALSLLYTGKPVGGVGVRSRQDKLGWDLKEWRSHEQANKCSFYRASGSGYLEMMEEECGCLGTDSPKRDKG